MTRLSSLRLSLVCVLRRFALGVLLALVLGYYVAVVVCTVEFTCCVEGQLFDRSCGLYLCQPLLLHQPHTTALGREDCCCVCVVIAALRAPLCLQGTRGGGSVRSGSHQKQEDKEAEAVSIRTRAQTRAQASRAVMQGHQVACSVSLAVQRTICSSRQHYSLASLVQHLIVGMVD